MGKKNNRAKRIGLFLIIFFLAASFLYSCGGGGEPAPILLAIDVFPDNWHVTVGETLQFTALGAYSDGTNQSLTTEVTWTSSDTSVATINSSGLATGVTAGRVTIEAALKISFPAGSTTLTVVNPS